ncbi:hypothetical protein ACFQ60_10800 [Streptomyces zhihengii]
MTGSVPSPGRSSPASRSSGAMRPASARRDNGIDRRARRTAAALLADLLVAVREHPGPQTARDGARAGVVEQQRRGQGQAGLRGQPVAQFDGAEESKPRSRKALSAATASGAGYPSTEAACCCTMPTSAVSRSSPVRSASRSRRRAASASSGVAAATASCAATSGMSWISGRSRRALNAGRNAAQSTSATVTQASSASRAVPIRRTADPGAIARRPRRRR